MRGAGLPPMIDHAEQAQRFGPGADGNGLAVALNRARGPHALRWRRGEERHGAAQDSLRVCVNAQAV